MREWEDSYYVNRTLCAVLDDIRLCDKTKNYAPLLSLIEEVQIKGNRMESALEDKNDMITMNEEWRELKKKIKEARKELKELTGGKSEEGNTD